MVRANSRTGSVFRQKAASAAVFSPSLPARPRSAYGRRASTGRAIPILVASPWRASPKGRAGQFSARDGLLTAAVRARSRSRLVGTLGLDRRFVVPTAAAIDIGHRQRLSIRRRQDLTIGDADIGRNPPPELINLRRRARIRAHRISPILWRSTPPLENVVVI